MATSEIESQREAFLSWRQSVSFAEDAERQYEEKFLGLKAELEAMGFMVEVHQDYLTSTHLLHNNLWRRTDCHVIRGALEFRTSELTHTAKAKVSALHEAFMRVLAWQQNGYEAESEEVPL
jgi:hypothetical protein